MNDKPLGPSLHRQLRNTKGGPETKFGVEDHRSTGSWCSVASDSLDILVLMLVKMTMAIVQWENPSRMWHYPWWSWPSCVQQLAMCWQGEADRDCGKRKGTTPILLHLSILDSRFLNVSHAAMHYIIVVIQGYHISSEDPRSAVSGWGNIPGYLPLLPHANQAEVCSPSAHASLAETPTQSPAEGWCLGGSCSGPSPLAKKP